MVPAVDEFKEHFMSLNSGTEIPTERNEHFKAADDANDKMNRAITEEEIVKCITKLKSNKAYGLDDVLNEYIKSTEKIIIKVYVKLFNIVLDIGLVPLDKSDDYTILLKRSP